MPKPAFFVDGYTELRAIQQICPGSTIRRLDTNGITVKMSAIAKAINVHFRLLNNRNYPIIVMIDREGREENCEVLIEQLKNCLKEIGLPLDQFYFGMCDRMIENWIIADHELMALRFGKNMGASEGAHGKATLKSLFSADLPYQETIHGVELLVEAKASNIAANSKSFAGFRGDFPVDCEWMNR